MVDQRIQNLSLRPRLHEIGSKWIRTQTVTDRPCVYTGLDGSEPIWISYPYPNGITFESDPVWIRSQKGLVSYMSEMFLPVGQSRVTRRSKNKLNQPFRKSNKGQNGLSYLGPKIWNNLHSDLKSAESVNSFKHKIKNKFFKDLQNQEDNPYEYY